MRLRDTAEAKPFSDQPHSHHHPFTFPRSPHLMSWLTQTAFNKAVQAAYDQDYLELPDIHIPIRWYTAQLLLEQLTKIGNSPHPFTPIMIPTSEALSIWGHLQDWHKNFGYHLDKISMPTPQPAHLPHQDEPPQATKKRRQQYQPDDPRLHPEFDGITSDLLQDISLAHLDPHTYVAADWPAGQPVLTTWEAIEDPEKYTEWKAHTQWNDTTYHTFAQALHSHPFAVRLAAIRKKAKEDSHQHQLLWKHPWHQNGWQYHTHYDKETKRSFMYKGDYTIHRREEDSAMPDPTAQPSEPKKDTPHNSPMPYHPPPEEEDDRRSQISEDEMYPAVK